MPSYINPLATTIHLPVSGLGGVPAFSASYNLIYQGVSRTITTQPDFVIINHGHNDSPTATATITASVTSTMNLLLAAYTKAQFFYVQPIGTVPSAAFLLAIQAGIAACNQPQRVSYITTINTITSPQQSSDGIHPYGWLDKSTIAPTIATNIQAAINNITRRYTHQ